MSLGVRVHFHIGQASIHPGLSYTRGLDATGPTSGSMITNRATAIAIDVPVLFKRVPAHETRCAVYGTVSTDRGALIG